MNNNCRVIIENVSSISGMIIPFEASCVYINDRRSTATSGVAASDYHKFRKRS